MQTGFRWRFLMQFQQVQEHQESYSPKVKRKNLRSTFLSDGQLEDIKFAFAKFDKDQSGSIKKNELINLMRSLGKNPTEKVTFSYQCKSISIRHGLN